MTGTCTCGAIRHAITTEHRDALTRALATAEQLGQDDLATHYTYRLESCPTATAETTDEAEGRVAS